MIPNKLPLGKQEYLSFTFLTLRRKYITGRHFIYSSFWNLCGFTVDETRSRELVVVL